MYICSYSINPKTSLSDYTFDYLYPAGMGIQILVLGSHKTYYLKRKK